MSNNCFANKNGKCAVLTVGKCAEVFDCVYYKTTQQFAADQQAAFRRLSSLAPEYQRHIAGVYRKGEMPWLAKGVVAE
jgi:hypothetical protein